MADASSGLDLFERLASCLDKANPTNIKWSEITDIMVELKLWTKQRENRIKISESNILLAHQVLTAFCQVISSLRDPDREGVAPSCLNAGTETFRFLRNAVAEVPNNQKIVVDVGIVDQVLLAVTTLTKPQYQELNKEMSQLANDAVKSGLQLVGNTVVQNQSTQDQVWKKCFPSLFLDLLAAASYQAQESLSMAIFNCLSPHNKAELVSSHEGHKILSHILHLCADHEELQWGFLILDNLIMSGHLSDVYTGLEFDPSARIILLDLIQVRLTGERSGDEAVIGSLTTDTPDPVPSESLLFLANQFEDNSRISIFDDKTNSPDNAFDALVVSRLLSVMCAATGLHSTALQDRSTLLQTGLELLHESNRPEIRAAFSQVTRVPRGVDSGGLSPSHGFKRDLVRLIGNMCYQHRCNQDKVREMHGIPLILDHCNVDDHNPYICQWAIFAVRNLLDNNLENQQVVASLDKKGLADTSRLHQFGVTARETDEGRIKVLPVKK